MVTALTLLLVLILAYLLGSIPTAVWVGQLFYHVDVREHGSHNAGATNTIRVLGIWPGLAVFAIDVLKGFLALWLGRMIFFSLLPASPMPYNALGIALGLAAFFGHVFPLFAHFKGGKGVATICGVALALHPWATLVALAIFALILATTRYVSLGSMLATLSYPLTLFFLFRVCDPWLLGFGIAITLLIVYTHRANIARLLHGQESRFSPTRHGSQGR